MFLAADPGMKHRTVRSGSGANAWGIWRQDPGPRGVRLQNARALEASGKAPAGWWLQPDEFWLDEHGLIMETPSPLPAGKYKVTWLNWRKGASRDVELSISTSGTWALDSPPGFARPTLHDVTHLPCRAAKYTQPSDGSKCLPEYANQANFPVTPGATMPAVPGCAKLDYAVLFLDAYWG